MQNLLEQKCIKNINEYQSFSLCLFFTENCKLPAVVLISSQAFNRLLRSAAVFQRALACGII